jgi:hypothetical protein
MYKASMYQPTFEAFNNTLYPLVFTKIDNQPQFSLYGAQIRSFLGDGNKYILLLTEKDDVSPGNTYGIRDIGWFAIQARTLFTDYGLVDQEFSIPRESPLNVLCHVRERKHDRSIYMADQLPLVVELIHRPELQNIYQYPDTVRITDCINSFNCSIRFV